jgi:hypothetical protein
VSDGGFPAGRVLMVAAPVVVGAVLYDRAQTTGTKLAIGGAMAFWLWLMLLRGGGLGGAKSVKGGITPIAVQGQSCFVANVQTPCGAVPGMFGEGEKVHVNATMGSHGTVEALLAGLEASGVVVTVESE